MATIISTLEALEILLSAGGDGDVDAGDEVLYAGEPGLKLTVPDRLRLEQLGWSVSAETGRWYTLT